MRQNLSAVCLSLCFLLSITALAQAQSQSGIGAKAVSLEISIIETDGAHVNEIARMKAGKDEINRLIAEGRIKIFASLEVRTRTGENFSAKAGLRVPIQTATLPALRTNERGTQDSRELFQSQGIAIAVPKIEYENTGLVVEGMAMPAGDGVLDIRLKIEMTGLDLSTGRLTPSFMQRTFTDVVRMKENETAMLFSLIQPAGRPVSLDQTAAGATNSAGGGMAVLLTARPIQ